MDEFWAEISDSIQAIEEIYEDKLYPIEVRQMYFILMTTIFSNLLQLYINSTCDPDGIALKNTFDHFALKNTFDHFVSSVNFLNSVNYILSVRICE